MGIQNDSVQSDLSMHEVSISTFPPTSVLEELYTVVVVSDWSSLCDSEVNERGLLHLTNLFFFFFLEFMNIVLYVNLAYS